MKYFITDQGREQFRDFIRKELNSLDNENLLDIEDRVLIKNLLKKLNKELN